MNYSQTPEEGYVYYIRLKTQKGYFWKIGFTTMSSVEMRFSYGSSENYKLIDQVLVFKYSIYAYTIEQKLHALLAPYRAYNRGLIELFRDRSLHPLFGDGQTELYREDVLGLDKHFRKPFGLRSPFSESKRDLVRRRKLSHYMMSPFEKEELLGIYSALDSFFNEPLRESKEEQEERKGVWVCAIEKWARQNGITSWLGVSLSSNKPMPTKKEELLNLSELNEKYMDSFPPGIEYLSNLETLKLPGCSAISIPEALYDLPKLQFLDLSLSDIRCIPGDIAKLRSLKVLDLSISKVASISSEIGKLKHLEVIDLFYCKELEEVPRELEDIEKLHTIRIREADYDLMRRCLPNKPELFEIVDAALSYRPALASNS